MIQPLRATLRARVPIVVASATIVVLVWLAWSLRFIQDDAFISYRYARNLLEGHGLVFNPGERVEGYTNFLWTILITCGMRLGVPVVLWSHLLGLASFAGGLGLLFLSARRLLGATVWGLAAVCLAGTNYSFSAYATGGLETSLQTFLALLALHVAARAWADPRPAALAAFASAAAAALLTRLDSVFLLVAPAAMLLWRIARTPAAQELTDASRRRLLLALALPAIVPLAAWFAWKAHYYGQLLPLTFYAKRGADPGRTVTQGAFFLLEYLEAYWMVPQLLLLLAGARSVWREPVTRWLGASCALWWLYVLCIGGDFMEFRFMTPILPAWILCVLWVLAHSIADRRVRIAMTAAAIGLALAGSWRHGATFEYEHGIESVTNLEEHLTVQRWDLIGRTLERVLGGDASPVTIAVTAAGAIPYYSGLRTVDMLGLNDAWIARHGPRLQTQPGHERTAPFRYLIERGVNLVIAHPLVAPEALVIDLSQGVDLREFRLVDVRREDLPEDMRLLEIPIGAGLKVLALYLRPNPRVEAAIRAEGWKSSPVVAQL